MRKKFFVKTTAKTVQRKKEIYEKYPCVELQFRLKNHQSQLSEIVFADKFIKELGYSEDSFISTVLNEGIPRLMMSEAPFSSEIRLLLENYFHISNDGFEAPENHATLLLKSGYVRQFIN